MPFLLTAAVLMTMDQPASVTLYPYASVYRGLLVPPRLHAVREPMQGVQLCILHKQEAAKEERKRKAATAKLAKEAQQAQQALQQMPGLQPPANLMHQFSLGKSDQCTAQDMQHNMQSLHDIWPADVVLLWIAALSQS